MKIPRKGSSIKQLAYARRVWGAEGADKKSIALDVGYSPNAAKSVMSKIESRPGFNNAIAKLAAESNNMALTVLSEFKARGLTDFSNADLIKALNSISTAWEKFNKGLVQSERPADNGKNRLKTVILQKIENQTNIQSEKVSEVKEVKESNKEAVETSVVHEEVLDF